MTDQLPHPFGSIVVRDCWQMQHLDVSLLSESDQDRLMNMPDIETTTPFGEAQELEDLIDEGLQTLLVPVQRATALSFLIIGTLQSSIYGDLRLSNTARIHLSSLLSPFSNKQKIKGSHQVFEEAIRVYSENVSQLRAIADIVTSKSTLENVKSQRNKLIEKLHQLADFILEPERLLLMKAQLLFGKELSVYLKTQDDAFDDAYKSFLQSIQQLIEEIHILDAYISSCILLPLLLGVKKAITAHYTATIHSKLPELSLRHHAEFCVLVSNQQTGRDLRWSHPLQRM